MGKHSHHVIVTDSGKVYVCYDLGFRPSELYEIVFSGNMEQTQLFASGYRLGREQAK